MIAEIALERPMVADEVPDQLNNGRVVSGMEFRRDHVTDGALIIENGSWDFTIPLDRLLRIDCNPARMTHTFTFEDTRGRSTQATFSTDKVGLILVQKRDE